MRETEYITEPFKHDSCETRIQRGQHVPLQDYLVETIKVKPCKTEQNKTTTERERERE